jgi:hypothetical protein
VYAGDLAVKAGMVVFVASMVALVLPAYRGPSLGVAEVAAWLIPAWLMIGGLVLGAVDYALNQPTWNGSRFPN